VLEAPQRPSRDHDRDHHQRAGNGVPDDGDRVSDAGCGAADVRSTATNRPEKTTFTPWRANRYLPTLSFVRSSRTNRP
jgi:hypothetical protein